MRMHITLARMIGTPAAAACRLIAAMALLMLPWLTSPHAEASHVRHGTIVGIGIVPGVEVRPGVWIGNFHSTNCTEAADCRAWLSQACPRVGGVDPALESSIVDIGALANGTTQRQFEVRGVDPAGNVADGVVVEFWGSSCSRIGGAKTVTRSAIFAVPPGSKWMTVIGTHNRFIEWWLT